MASRTSSAPAIVLRLDAPGGRIGHAELTIGDSVIMLADEHPEMGALSPSSVGGTPVGLHLYVADVDAITERAVAAGGKLLQAPETKFYGDRGSTIDEVLQAVELESERRSRYHVLSGGQKQRVALATALVGSPELLFLDEPTTGLDPRARQSLWRVVERFRAGGGTVLLTTHYMEEAAALCDAIIIMDHGRVIANEPTRELVSKAQEKAVVVTFDRDIATMPADACFENITLIDERTLEITYRKDRVNAGQVLTELQKDGLAIVDVTTRDPDLEDVFLSLVSADQEAA